MFDFEMPPLDWRDATIPKRSGGVRQIHIPNDELKETQRSILRYLYTVPGLRPSKYAHGFVPYRNTATGASQHDKLADVIICMDVRSFFDNFPAEPVRKRMIEAGVGAVLVDKIIESCSYNGAFPQGGPCSPCLTNIGMFEADHIIAAYARNNGLAYSRYADDITLSRSPGTDVDLKKDYTFVYYAIDTILREHLGLTLKRSKSHTIWRSGSSPRRITGVVIRKDGMGYNAPKNMRRMARAAAHNLHKKLMSQNGVPCPEDWKEWCKVVGYIQYFDYLRSYGEGAAATADPMIQEEGFAHLCWAFDYKKERTNGRATE